MRRRINGSIITVDPGTQATGVAIWDHAAWLCEDTLQIPQTHLLKPPRRADTWERRVDSLTSQFIDIMPSNAVRMYVEFPQRFDGSTKGIAAQQGSTLFKLAHLIGAYCGVCSALNIRWSVVTVNEWKGQLPKDVVCRRLIRMFAQCGHTLVESAYNHDVWDAIGIGVYKQGNEI